MTPASEIHPVVTFWGTRGSVSTPGRITEKYGGNTPCVTVCYQDIFIIFDAGTGIRNLGVELVGECGKQPDLLNLHLFLSHTHWDHIQGLPFFKPAYDKDTRITIYGSPRKGRFLASILKDQMDYEYFPVSMSAFAADIRIREISSGVIQLGPVTVDWQEQVYHPGGSMRYRLNINGKKIVYATDVELDRFFNSDESGAENEAQAKDYLDFIRDADLLIADGQYTEEEYAQKAGWGHTSIPVLLDAAFRSRVKQLVIFHHDPQHSDIFLDGLWVKNRDRYLSTDNKMDIFWAREGMSLPI